MWYVYSGHTRAREAPYRSGNLTLRQFQDEASAKAFVREVYRRNEFAEAGELHSCLKTSKITRENVTAWLAED